jgi:hypothetical protein
MIFILIVIAILVGLLIWQVASDARTTRFLIIRASDLNLEAHARLLEHFEDLDRRRDNDAEFQRLRETMGG